jgi:hypothetical protein
MNYEAAMRRLKDFPLSAILFILPFFLFSCEKSFEPIPEVAYISKEVVADAFGNHDGITTRDELDFVDQYFKTNDDAWCVGVCYDRYWYNDQNTIGCNELVEMFGFMKCIGPYGSEEKLRESFPGTRTPFVGIYTLKHTYKYRIYRFFRASGPRVSTDSWIELIIQ